MSEDIQRAIRYRNYAEELRLIAADKATPENRQRLISAAEDYDRMADSLEAVDRTKRAQGRPR